MRKYYANRIQSSFVVDEGTVYGDSLRLMALAREVRCHNIDYLRSYSFQQSVFDDLIMMWLQDKNRPLLADLESEFMHDIIHDVIFTSPDGYLLEGSTFSLLAL